MSTTTNPAPGWYPHPQGVAATDMYWDGNGWQESMIRPQTAPKPNSKGPMTHGSLDVKREVIYNRQQKGHSVIVHTILGVCTAGISLLWTWYYAASPNHYFHA